MTPTLNRLDVHQTLSPFLFICVCVVWGRKKEIKQTKLSSHFFFLKSKQCSAMCFWVCKKLFIIFLLPSDFGHRLYKSCVCEHHQCRVWAHAPHYKVIFLKMLIKKKKQNETINNKTSLSSLHIFLKSFFYFLFFIFFYRSTIFSMISIAFSKNKNK